MNQSLIAEHLSWLRLDACPDELAIATMIEDLVHDRDEWKARAEFSYQERDKLRADNERLTHELEVTTCRSTQVRDYNAWLLSVMQEAWEDGYCFCGPEGLSGIQEWFQAALTLTPAQSLAHVRNKAKDEAIEACRKAGPQEYPNKLITDGYVAAIEATKEVE